MNTALTDAWYDRVQPGEDRVAKDIGLLVALMRNRAYSQALQLIEARYYRMYKQYYLQMKRAGWQRPAALEEILKALKNHRDELAKVGGGYVDFGLDPNLEPISEKSPYHSKNFEWPPSFF